MEDTLFKLCQRALDQAIAESKDNPFDFFTVNSAVEIVNGLTTPAEWDRNVLFDRLVRSYIAMIAATKGFRSGKRGKGVYFDEDTNHKFISGGLVMNAKDLADRYKGKAEELEENHNIKFKKGAMDRQTAFDGDGSFFEERSLEALIDMILQGEANK